MVRTKIHKKEKKRGPKGKFQDSMIKEVFKLARFGHTNLEICEFYNIHESTFDKYRQLYPEFDMAMEKGRLLASLNVVASLYKQAMGYEVEEVTTDTYIDKEGNEKVRARKIVKKHIQPSTTAGIYLLKVRHGDKWMDVYKHEFNSINNIKLSVDLRGINDEELKLMEKIGMRQLAIQTQSLLSNDNRN